MSMNNYCGRIRTSFLNKASHGLFHIFCLPNRRKMCGTILLSNIPGHCEMMSKSGNQFTQIKFALGGSMPSIKKHFIFSLLQYKVYHHSQFFHMVKNNLPLI